MSVAAGAVAALIGWGPPSFAEDVRATSSWTWAMSPTCSPVLLEKRSDDRCRGIIRISTLAVTNSGAAIVGGILREPIVLPGLRLGGRTEATGFIGRISVRGELRVVRLLGTSAATAERWEEPSPSAVVVGKHGHVFVSQHDGLLVEMTEQGQIVRMNNRLYAPARSLLEAADGDLVATGCELVTRSNSMAFGETYPVNKKGYVERLAPKGDVRWKYLFSSDALLDLSNSHDCGTALATAPDGGVYVAGTYSNLGELAVRNGGDGWPSSGSFLARFTRDGHLAWSKLMSATDLPLALAGLPEGRVAVSGKIMADRGGEKIGLRIVGPDGVDVWSLTAEGLDADWRHRVPLLATRGRRIFWTGTFAAPIEIAGISLVGTSPHRSRLFLARVDLDGKVKSVADISSTHRGRRMGSDDDMWVTAIAVGAAAWLVGNLEPGDDGSFAQRLDD